MNLDLRLFQEIEKNIGERLERHASELVAGKSIDYADYRFRVGVIKGLREALSAAQDANDEIIGINKAER